MTSPTLLAKKDHSSAALVHLLKDRQFHSKTLISGFLLVATSLLLLSSMFSWLTQTGSQGVQHHSAGHQDSFFDPQLYIVVSSRWSFLEASIQRLIQVSAIPAHKITIILSLDDDAEVEPDSDAEEIDPEQENHVPKQGRQAAEYCQQLTESYGVQFYWIKPPSRDLHVTAKMTRAFYEMFRFAFEDSRNSFAIFLEDDLDTSADFYQYFRAVARLMHMDSTVLCGSAWSDNAYFGTGSDESVFMRGQHYMGLGWMMSSANYYKWLKPILDVEVEKMKLDDDLVYEWEMHIRRIMLRNGELECIFPEISRTHHTIRDSSKVYSVSPRQQQLHFDLMPLASGFSNRHLFDLSILQRDTYDLLVKQFITDGIFISLLEDILSYRSANLVYRCNECVSATRTGWQGILEGYFGAYSFGAVESIVRGVYKETVFLRVASNRVVIVGKKSPFFDMIPEKGDRVNPSFIINESELKENAAVAGSGKSCAQHCRSIGKQCNEQYLAFLNICKRLTQLFPTLCETCSQGSRDELILPAVYHKEGSCFATTHRHLNCYTPATKSHSRFCLCQS